MERGWIFQKNEYKSTFSAGLDPAEMAEQGRAMLDNLVNVDHFLFHQIKSDVESEALECSMLWNVVQVSELINFPKPLIAAVNGPTVSKCLILNTINTHGREGELSFDMVWKEADLNSQWVTHLMRRMFATLPLFYLVCHKYIMW